jgi:hypothetical protein
MHEQNTAQYIVFGTVDEKQVYSVNGNITQEAEREAERHANQQHQKKRRENSGV